MHPWLEDRCHYFPILHVLPSDLEALQLLPNADGNYLCPVVPLQPWRTAHTLDKAIARVRSSMAGKRDRFIVDISDRITPTPGTKKRPVHDDLAKLNSSADDCKAWRDFIAGHDDMIPVVRTPPGLTPKGLAVQISEFMDLGRGMVLRLNFTDSQKSAASIEIAEAVAAVVKAPSEIMFVFDFGKIREETFPALAVLDALNKLRAVVGDGLITLATGATSFPSSFGSISGYGSQTILERRLFELVEKKATDDGLPVNIRYGDYGSARVRERAGGGGDMPARVDYAARTHWHFNRRDGEDRDDNAYIAAAKAITSAPFFDTDLKIYGANVIRAAAGGDVTDLDSQTKVTTVRINLHLHAQAHYRSSRAEFLAGGGDDQPWAD